MGSIGGSASQSKTKTNASSKGESYDKMTPAQKAQYDKLLSGADDWLDSGGSQQDAGDFDSMRELLGGAGKSYMDTLSGVSGGEGLQNMLDIQTTQATDNLNQLTADIGQSANNAGSAGGSRQGIASGLAASNANKRLSEQQNKTMFDWQNAESDRKLQAAQGINATAGSYGNLAGQQMSESEQRLQNLAAYKGLVGGDMGGVQEGTTASESESDSTTTTVSAEASYSDKNLKTNVKNTGKKVRVNKTGKEINEKSYDFTEEAQDKYGLPDGKQKGVIAQDVEKEDPSAVSNSKKKKGKKSRKKVDYDKLSKAYDSI